MKRESIDNHEFLDAVRACVGLEPIPNAPVARNRAKRAVEEMRFGDALMMTGLFADDALRTFDGEPEPVDDDEEEQS